MVRDTIQINILELVQTVGEGGVIYCLNDLVKRGGVCSTNCSVYFLLSLTLLNFYLVPKTLTKLWSDWSAESTVIQETKILKKICHL